MQRECHRLLIRRRPKGSEPLGLVHRALVNPPAALTPHVVARVLAEIGRTEDEDLEALRPGLVTSPRAGRDAHHVPLLDLDDLLVELHPPAPAHDHVHLLLLLVRVAVREAIVGRDALVAEAALLEPERLACMAELQVRGAVEVGPEILQILLEVPARERHGRDPTLHFRPRGAPLGLRAARPSGFEPETFGSVGRADHHDARRRRTTEPACRHGLRAIQGPRSAEVSGSLSGTFGPLAGHVDDYLGGNGRLVGSLVTVPVSTAHPKEAQMPPITEIV